MKLKRFVAIIMVIAIMLMSFVACRTKDEVAYTFTYKGQDVSISTAMYMCFMVDADMEFESSATAKAEEDGTKYTSYKELKYEDKDYNTWVKDTVKEKCMEYAYYQVMFEKMGIEGDIDAAYLNGGDGNYYTAEQFYEAYKDTYSANGVSLSTYKEYMYNTQYKAPMVYGFYIEEAEDVEEHADEEHTHEDGSTHSAEETTTAKKLDKDIEALRGSMVPKEKELKNAVKENILPVYKISFALTTDSGEEVSSDTKKAYKNYLNEYKDALADGKKIEDVYKQYLVDSGQATSIQEAQVNGEYETSLYSKAYNDVSSNTPEETQDFSTIKKLGDGEAKVVESDAEITLYVRKNALKDKDYSGKLYYDVNRSNAIFFLTYDVFNDDVVAKEVKTIKVQANDSALNYYTPERIQETTTQAVETQAQSAVEGY